MLYRFLLFFYLAGLSPLADASSIKGRVELGLNLANALPSYQDKGTGILRFDDNGAKVFQGLLHYHTQVASGLSATVIANAYLDGEQHLGLTQAFVQYKPLSPNAVRFKYRTGFFYPHWSVENTDDGWLSPYTYTQSAINSWIGEEVRIAGFEASAFSNGRRRQSPWSWEINTGIFKGNDPAGTLLSWRGFAYHDRQSLHRDRVNFAAIPSIVDQASINSPSWVEPFEEIDGRWGYYIGAHLNYQRSSLIKYYYYNNNADASALNAERLYAWDTKFHSLAVSHTLSPSLRLLSQLLHGSTDMGPNAVFVDYTSVYLMLSYSHLKHRLSTRLEYASIREDDTMPQDQNDSHTAALTTAWRYKIKTNLELGIELHVNKNDAKNRSQLLLPTAQTDQQARFVLAYTF
ncbi:hypothetical protein ACFO4O_08050 [Glaciecola siphonariae]|uniref:Porin n=1 Tax=Glaciecola siphonariae TaxID=521012 RepID=A0ABV9LUA7_9ALTE